MTALHEVSQVSLKQVESGWAKRMQELGQEAKKGFVLARCHSG